jgi:hypothetical protein
VVAAFFTADSGDGIGEKGVSSPDFVFNLCAVDCWFMIFFSNRNCFGEGFEGDSVVFAVMCGSEFKNSGIGVDFGDGSGFAEFFNNVGKGVDGEILCLFVKLIFSG